jgi:hypothetical protein
MSDDKPRPMDDPDIDARQFLFRTMHEPSLDLAVRMDAADKLLQLGLGDYREEEVHITIRTRGPRLEDLTAEMKRDHLLGKRRDELGIVDPRNADWDCKGHA